MANTIRLQAKLKDGITEVKALITHPMETGSRKDLKTGKLIPAQYIEELTVFRGDKKLLDASWGYGVSKNPYCAFQFKGGNVGDKIRLSWKDNLGETDSAETSIME
jgi:sulfur-oxidizing protein SoxZ